MEVLEETVCCDLDSFGAFAQSVCGVSTCIENVCFALIFVYLVLILEWMIHKHFGLDNVRSFLLDCKI